MRHISENIPGLLKTDCQKIQIDLIDSMSFLLLYLLYYIIVLSEKSEPQMKRKFNDTGLCVPRRHYMDS